jgi:hypothetical protein
MALRKIKQSNFDYSSPLAHRYSLYAILGTFYVLLIGLTLPFPVPPQAIPIAWIGVAVAFLFQKGAYNQSNEKFLLRPSNPEDESDFSNGRIYGLFASGRDNCAPHNS